MKKLAVPIIFSLFILFLIWINLPVSLPVNFNIAGKKVDFKIAKPTLTWNTQNGPVTKDFDMKLGLDLKGGSSLVFEVDTSKVTQADLQDALDSSRNIIERRVNMFGISEPSVKTIKSGNIYRIAVDLPGIQDVSEAVGLIGSTAQLSFKEMSDVDEKMATNTPSFLLLTKDTGLGGKEVKKASVTFSEQDGKPEVLLEFTPTGSKKFGEITKRNVGKQVAIYLDEQVLSAPVVQQPILDGNAVINGDFTTEEAKQLAIAINGGALPLPIKLVQQQSIGPTLGASEIQKSLIAGVVGLAMVMLFMIAYYGRLGIIACVALVIYGLISLAIFRAIPIVLTLPGIAGFILSIGMAVDSNILIFERIKDELRKKREFHSAVRLGFGRAMAAIKDANMTTLLVAFVLFNPLNWEFLPQFGLVRGFALTLAIGVITSLFTGVIITRRLIDIFFKEQK